MAETRTFTVHPAILFSIIHSQAGTLAKAMLEAVMNAIDAGATKCDINLTSTTFVCKDNGRGFTSRQEILEWFERFGTPHQEGDATYGRFRMGRGQMMAFGSTVWHTGQFKMEVDIKNRGLDYDLHDLTKPVKGCTIEGAIYNPLSMQDLNSVIAELSDLVQFAQIPVHLNGKVVSKSPSKLKWDIETDDAYIKLNASRAMKVYNLGVLVNNYGSHRFGTGGIVVSKKPLDVNFARNSILEHSCEVWRRIKAVLDKQSKKHVAKKATLSEDERAFLARNIMAGDAPENLDVRIITTATGTHVPLSSFMYARKVCLAPKDGDRLAERLHRAQVGFVVSPKTLDRFNVDSLEELVKELTAKLGARFYGPSPVVLPFATIAEGYSASHNVVADKDATPEELDALRNLRRANLSLANWLNNAAAEGVPACRTRRVMLGQSDSAYAWTNGTDKITVDRKFLLRSARGGLNGWFQLFMVMLHEYCHVDADLDGHEHPPEFFETFEDLACGQGNPIGALALGCATVFASQQVEAGRKLSASAAKSVSVARDDAGRALQQSAVTLVQDAENEGEAGAPAAQAPEAMAAKQGPRKAKASRKPKARVSGKSLLAGTQLSLFG